MLAHELLHESGLQPLGAIKNREADGVSVFAYFGTRRQKSPTEPSGFLGLITFSGVITQGRNAIDKRGDVLI